MTGFSIADAVGARATGKDWTYIAPINDDHLDVVQKSGPRLGRNLTESVNVAFHYPTGGQRDELGRLWIANYYAQIQRMTEAMEVDFTLPVTYQAPASGDGIAYLQDMSVTTDGSGLILAVSYGHHCVKVYDRDTGDLVSTIGVPNGLGALDVGRLRNPHSAIRLPNGNIAVSAYNGNETGSANRGSISEWDISAPTATLVAARMVFATNGGQSAVGNNAIYGPMRMILDNDGAHVWISEYRRGRILKVDSSTWNTVDIITSPSESPSINSAYGLTQMEDGTIVVAANAGQRIIGIDPVSKAEVFSIDPTEYGSSANNMRGVFEIEPGVIAWADWTTQLIYSASVAPVSVQYETPSIRSGFLRQGLPDGMSEDYVLTVPANEVASRAVPLPILSQKDT